MEPGENLRSQRWHHFFSSVDGGDNLEESLRFTDKLGIPADRVTDIRSRTHIIITASADCMHDYSGQIMLEVGVNLLARIFPHVSVEVDCIPAAYLKTQKPLDEHLQSVIQDSYTWKGIPDNPRSDFYFVVGNLPVEGNAVYVDAEGWASFVGVRPSSLNEKSSVKIPVGSVAAACLGVAEIVKQVYKDYIPNNLLLVQDGIWFNTLTYNDRPTPNINCVNIHLDRVVLFGCGSIGSSLLYVLSFIPEVTGFLDIVDRDRKIDKNNLQRYSLLTVSDVRDYQGVSKARWAAEKTKRRLPDLSITPWDGQLGEIVKYLNANPSRPVIKLAVSAVDNIEARIQIADCLAKRTINAGTGDTTLTITRHGFADGKACLACYYIANTPNVSWYQEVGNQTGLPVDRVAYLLQGRAVINMDDLNTMVVRGFITADQIEDLVNTDFASLVNRRLYSAVNVKSDDDVEKPVTAPYVSTMAGALLAGELIKEICGLQDMWAKNKYQTDMLSLPEKYTTWVPKGGLNCLCANHFRVQKYSELWSTR